MKDLYGMKFLNYCIKIGSLKPYCTTHQCNAEDHSFSRFSASCCRANLTKTFSNVF